ncbi:D-hexose-6-phosphate mutarotase [Sulfurimonas sp.]|uniref:D-hexose-6-phosphate mutarotase n=1 Tax=Sulfurimonas sp. TaxID=2022749 RepID=UPI00263061C0|nr:D-hexose-6-phosphate mutarotase [Sulfurimonas sp.]MDD5157702.1 D-hexose-6-phosphate mutarotase [Sulfurimonas sp.]
MEVIVVTIEKLSNGFEYILVQNSSAVAKIALQGAHLFHYCKTNEEPLLWLSDISYYEQGKAIRGGIPICWPWFGFHKDKTLPQHGFARTSIWKFVSSDEPDAKTSSVIFRLTHSDETLKMWNHKFDLELKITINDSLKLELKTTNLDEGEFTITQALHTYFAVSDISEVSINGLNKKPYLDALTLKQEIQDGDIFFNSEVDRVYQKVDGEVILRDKNREITIMNSCSSSVVVWNPWIEKTKRMSAMREDAYRNMLCIESSNAYDDAVVVKPNSSHTLEAVILSLHKSS